MLESTQEYTLLAALTVGENPRASINMAIRDMMVDLSQNGMQTRIWTWKNPNTGKIEVIRGHRRRAGAILLQTEEPELYKELFPKGIPCDFFKDITEEEVWDLKIDEGNTQPLKHAFELQTCVNHLFGNGRTERSVVVKLAGLIDRIHTPKAKVMKDLRKIDDAIELACVEKDVISLAKLEKDRIDREFDSRRGTIQHYHRVYRCPNIVMAAQKFGCIGEKDAEYKGEYLPALTQAHITKLFDAFKVDLEDLGKDGLPKYNKRTPGPKFAAAWDGIIEKEKTKQTEKATGVKNRTALGKTALDKEIEEGQWLSKGFQKLTQAHAGHEVSGLKQDDKNLYFAEMVQFSNPKLWAEVVAEATEMEAIQNETAKATKNTTLEVKKTTTKAKVTK